MLQDILAAAHAFYEARLKTGSTKFWYRGHRRADWTLVSTLHRYFDRLTAGLARPLSPDQRRELLREESKSLYRQFQLEAWPLLAPIERSDWGILLTMQHYGLPTRLLDWTESFACALFFAQQHREPGDVATVWMLDSERLNEISLGERGVLVLDENVVLTPSVHDLRPWHPKFVPPKEDIPTIAATPLFTNPRMTAQRSVFTLSGDTFIPLEQQFDGRLLQEGALVRIDLPPERFDEVADYLRLNGLRAYTYFPDLNGLAQDHAARVEEMLRNIRRYLPQLLGSRG